MSDSDQIKDVVKRQFSKNAGKYVTSTTHAKGSDLSLLIEWLNPQPDWKALDVATGGGHVAKQLSRYVNHVFSTDLTRGMLTVARDHISSDCQNVSFVVADAENQPFLDETFDVVTCRIAAHHFPDPQKFVSESARVLKANGKMLLIDNVVPADDTIDAFVNRIEKLRDESHVRCWRVEEWTAWAEACGLYAVQSTLRKKTFDFPTWVRRTTKSEEQVEEVTRYILQASKELKEYCGLVLKDGQIQSIHIDEWMVLWEKSATDRTL